MIKTKAFIEADGVKYYDYDFYSDDSNHRYDKFNVVVSNALRDKLCSCSLDELDMAFVPKDGDTICPIPKCILPIDDLRKNYKVKRGYDNATCNVFSPVNEQWTNIWWKCVIIPSKKAVIEFTGDSIQSCNKTAKEAFGTTNVLYMPDNVIIKAYEAKGLTLEEPYLKLLSGQLTKPSIPYTSLRINSNNELTYDVLYLVYKTGVVKLNHRDWYSDGVEGDIKNLTVELNVMNNYNWREYPGTMSVLRELMFQHDTIASAVNNCISRYPKAVKNILRAERTGFASKKDMDMAKRLVSDLLGLDGVKFVSTQSLLSKLNGIKLSLETFDKLYSVVTRISEKEFVNEEKN